MIAAPRPLHAVPPPAAEPPVDIQAEHRAYVASRDWAKVHIEGDRNPPLSIGERVKRGWRG